MNFVDLHVHSNASDGTLTPAKVVELAAQKGLSAFALTDHDTIEGIPEAQKAAQNLPLEVIPGIELSCVYLGEEIHILGLYVDLSDKEFLAQTDHLKDIRIKRNEEIINRFQKAGMDITLSEVQAGNPDTVITRAHFARILLEKGYVKSMDQAFKKYLSYTGPYCPRKEKNYSGARHENTGKLRRFTCSRSPLPISSGRQKNGRTDLLFKRTGASWPGGLPLLQ